MADNLDLEWVNEYPPLPAEQLVFNFMGKQLMRLPEVPLEAFQIVELHPTDFMPLVRACRICLNPTCHAEFDQLIPPDDPEMNGVGGGAHQYMTVPRAVQLWRYLLRQGGGIRPTQPSTDSSDGRSQTGTTSTDGTSTPTEGWGSGDSVPGASPTSPTPIESPSASS